MRRPFGIVIVILVLAALAGFFDYPVLSARASEWWNARVPYLKIPRFSERPFKLGLDLAGGSRLVYEADVSALGAEERDQALAGLRDVIERRVNIFGVAEPIVRLEQSGESRRLVVELAGVYDSKAAIQTIGATPYLEFRELKSEPETITATSSEVAAEIESLFQATALTGRFLKKTELGFDPTTYQPEVNLVFDEEGGRLFQEITKRNIGKPLAIAIDDVVISSPTVQHEIDAGRAVITGINDVTEARSLVENLQAGALPVPIHLIAQSTVGASLGKASLEKSLAAAVAGFLLVGIFMVFWYRLGGVAAFLTLTIYAAIVLAIFKLIPVVLTLAGIAGFILSLGMAVDGNILFFERLREELAQRRIFAPALAEARRRSWPSIRDSQFTTVLAAAVLFLFGTSLVKGFGLTLAIGSVLSIATSIGITPLFLQLVERTRLANYRWLWG